MQHLSRGKGSPEDKLRVYTSDVSPYLATDASSEYLPVSWIDAPGSKVDTKKEIQRFLRDLVNIQMNNFKGVYERK